MTISSTGSASEEVGTGTARKVSDFPSATGAQAAVSKRFPVRKRSGARSERVVGDIVALMDFCLVVSAAGLAKFIYINGYLGKRQEIEFFLAIGVIAGFIAVSAFRNQNLYTLEILSRFRGTTRRVAFGMALAAVVILSVGYFLKVSTDLSRGWMITWVSTASFLIIVNHLLVSRAIRRWAASGLFTRNIAIYGSGEIASRIVEHLSLATANLRILGVFDDLPRGATPRVVLAGGLSNLIQMGQTADIDEVLLALPLSDERRISGLVTQLSVLPTDIRLCPDMAAFQMRPLGIVNYEGVPILELVRQPLHGWGPIVKKIEDWVLASLALLAVAPLLALIAIAIKLDSPGPVLFRQRRHGFNHQVITVLKFRTMRVTQDGSVVPQASRDDPR